MNVIEQAHLNNNTFIKLIYKLSCWALFHKKYLFDPLFDFKPRKAKYIKQPAILYFEQKMTT